MPAPRTHFLKLVAVGREVNGGAEPTIVWVYADSDERAIELAVQHFTGERILKVRVCDTLTDCSKSTPSFDHIVGDTRVWSHHC